MDQSDRNADILELSQDKPLRPKSSRSTALARDELAADAVRDALLSPGDPFSDDAALLRNLLRLARDVVDSELRARVVASLLPMALDAQKAGPDITRTVVPAALSMMPYAKRAAWDLAWTPPSAFPGASILSIQPAVMKGFTLTVRPPTGYSATGYSANGTTPTAEEMQNAPALSDDGYDYPTVHPVSARFPAPMTEVEVPAFATSARPPFLLAAFSQNIAPSGHFAHLAAPCTHPAPVSAPASAPVSAPVSAPASGAFAARSALDSALVPALDPALSPAGDTAKKDTESAQLAFWRLVFVAGAMVSLVVLRLLATHALTL